MLSYRSWLIIAIALFGAGILLGVLMPVTSAELLNDDMTALREMAAMLGPFQFSTAVFIFFKNVLALAVSFVFSPILLLVPVLALTMNGWIISFVSVMVAREESWGFLLAGILPHGILELPAIIMGEAAALSFGALTITALFSKGKKSLIIPNIKQNAKYLLIAVALLLPAAVIETYITPLFMP